MKLHVNYSKEGNNHSDFKAVEIVEKAIAQVKDTPQEIELNTTNQNVVNAVRVALKKRQIVKEEVVFYYEREPLIHDSEGEFQNYPNGFLEINTNLLLQLL